MEKIIGFHATDKALANSIIANGFSFSRSEEHWLGNGVYFFADPDLAVWWGNNPTNKFGVKIERPCILRSTIEAENICDMRLLEDYTFVRVMLPVFKRYLTAHGIKFASNNIDAKFRCAFFDWLYNRSRCHCRSIFLALPILPQRWPSARPIPHAIHTSADMRFQCRLHS